MKAWLLLILDALVTPFDRSSLTRWRQRMGEAKLAALIQESPAAATRTGAPPDRRRILYQGS